MFLEEGLLGLLDRGQEINYPLGQPAEGTHHPPLGIQVGLQIHQVEHLVLDVELEFAGEKAAQVAVDEIIAGVAAAKVTQPAQKQRHLRLAVGDVLFRALVLSQQCAQVLVRHSLQDARHCLLQDGLLGLAVASVCAGLLWRGQAVLKGQGEGAAVRVVSGRIGPGEEVATAAFGVVSRYTGRGDGEADAVCAGQVSYREGIVQEAFVGLDIVLVAVGPVEEDLLSPIGDGVGLAGPVASPGDEIALLVVAAEKRDQVIEHLGLVPLGDFDRPEFAAGLRVRPSHSGVGVGGSDFAARQDGVVGEVILNLLGQSLDLPLQILFVTGADFGKGGVYLAWQLRGDEGLDLVLLDAEQAVEAKVEIGQVELEK